MSAAVKEYLEDCLDRQGKSGYGLAVRTPKTYEDRLCFLIEFRPKAYLDEIDAEFVKGFRRFLRQHKKDLGDRTCYDIMQAVSTFLLRCGNSAAKAILKEMSFPPTIVVPYSDDDLQKFFGSCNEEEELLFKFFLHSMARDMEVANCEVRDLKFDINVLHISVSFRQRCVSHKQLPWASAHQPAYSGEVGECRSEATLVVFLP